MNSCSPFEGVGGICSWLIVQVHVHTDLSITCVPTPAFRGLFVGYRQAPFVKAMMNVFRNLTQAIGMTLLFFLFSQQAAMTKRSVTILLCRCHTAVTTRAKMMMGRSVIFGTSATSLIDNFRFCIRAPTGPVQTKNQTAHCCPPFLFDLRL